MTYTKLASSATCTDLPNSSVKDRDDVARNAVHAEFQPRNARATLKARFLPEDSGPYTGLYRGARCQLPTGEVVEVHRKRTPLYDLARELQNLGYGEWQLQAFTHTGTPSLHGQVKVMAKLTVSERDRDGLRLEKYRSFPTRGRATDARVGPAGTRGPAHKRSAVSVATATSLPRRR